jgi:hypothetical protein
MLAGTAIAASSVNAQSLDQTREYAAEVLADAEQRTSLLGASAHHANFGFTSADGTSTLNISGGHQTRFTINARDDNSGAQDEFETGFSNGFTLIQFDGSIVSPDTTYELQMYVNSSGNFMLRNAILAQDFGNGTSGWVGQFVVPTTRESMQQDQFHNQRIERSVTDMVFGAGLTQGVGMSHTNEENTWRVSGSFNDGAGTANTAFNSGAESEFGITVRGDFAFEGSVDPFYDNLRNFGTTGDDAMVAGGYFHIQQTQSPSDTTIAAGADFLMASKDGWNVFAAGHLRDTEIGAGGDDSFLDLGLNLQGGMFIDEQTEIFAGWDCVNPDDDRAGDSDPFNTVTVGVNHFPFAGSQAVMISGAVVVFVDATTETGGLVSSSPSAGLLTDTEGGQVAVVGQAQLTF